jgi:toxin YhaV
MPGWHLVSREIPRDLMVYAWVNDESTLRKAGARTDPYLVFQKRLRDGNPPDDWDGLIERSASYTLSEI